MVKDKIKRRSGSNLLYVRVQDYAASHNITDAEVARALLKNTVY